MYRVSFFNIIIARVPLKHQRSIKFLLRDITLIEIELGFQRMLHYRTHLLYPWVYLWPNVLLVQKKSLVSRVSSKFEQFPSDCRIIRITKFDANMSICFICEQSISEGEKPVGARGRHSSDGNCD